MKNFEIKIQKVPILNEIPGSAPDNDQHAHKTPKMTIKPPKTPK